MIVTARAETDRAVAQRAIAAGIMIGTRPDLRASLSDAAAEIRITRPVHVG